MIDGVGSGVGDGGRGGISYVGGRWWCEGGRVGGGVLTGGSEKGSVGIGLMWGEGGVMRMMVWEVV